MTDPPIEPWESSLPAMPTLPITSEATLQRCAALEVGENDVFICSFPKSGTTWTQAIVHKLFQLESQLLGREGAAAEEPVAHISDFAPFFEVDRTWDDGEPMHRKYGVRAFNTHLRWEMMPKHPKCRYLYLYRSGEDVCTSFFHHLSNQEEDDGGFVEETDDYQILFLRYEDLIADLGEQLLRVVKHLNLRQLSAEFDHHVAGLVESLSFEGKKEEADFYQPRSVRWKNDFRFLRKGVQGDSKSLLSDAQFEMFRQKVQDDFGGTLPEWMDKEGLLLARNK